MANYLPKNNSFVSDVNWRFSFWQLQIVSFFFIYIDIYIVRSQTAHIENVSNALMPADTYEDYASLCEQGLNYMHSES